MSNLFYFVKPIDEELYQYCIQTEKLSKTNPTTASGELRNALEYFMKWFFEFNRLSRFKEDGKEKTIYEMIEEAKTKGLLLDWQVKDLHNIRRYGNQFNHTKAPGEVQKKAKVSELVRYLQKLHNILVNYFRYKRLLKKKLAFNEDKLMIGSYKPIRNLNINTYEEGCQKKFFCQMEDEDTKSITYYVIRQFKRSDDRAPKETSFLKRDLLALQKLSMEDLNYIVKNHNVPVEADNELFFTCYELSESDINLIDINTKELSVQQRLNIISQIARGLYGMHQADEAVFHRALNPSSIYLKKKKNGTYLVKIGNFEYSKLEDVNGVTVVSKLFRRSRDPFRAPEVEFGIEIKDWSKTDVYSFGMLILYIFNIRGENAFHFVKDLGKFGLSAKFIELVKKMVDELPSDRPSIEEVGSTIRKEVAAHE